MCSDLYISVCFLGCARNMMGLWSLLNILCRSCCCVLVKPKINFVDLSFLHFRCRWCGCARTRTTSWSTGTALTLSWSLKWTCSTTCQVHCSFLLTYFCSSNCSALVVSITSVLPCASCLESTFVYCYCSLC